jgi:hypothetical protein
MPEQGDEARLPRRPGGAARRGNAAASRPSAAGKKRTAARECVDCEVRAGLPTVRGKAQAHYRTGQGGLHMLVLDRRPGERIRINATTEIVILEIGPELVKIAVETVEDDTSQR